MPIGGELTPQEVIILEEGHEAVLAVVGSIKAKLQASLTKLAISLQDSNATAEVIEEAAKFERLCRELQSNLETTQRLRAYIDARKPALAAAP